MKRASTRHETTNYEQMGIAALLPGLIFAGELIQTRIRELQDQLAGIMTNGTGKRGPGRPPNPLSEEKASRAGGSSSGWPTDPEERKAEAARRREVALERQRLEQRSLAGKKGGKARWANRPKKEVAAHLAMMAAARKAKEKKRPPRGSANPAHPGHPDHPDHAAFVARMTAARKARANRERAAA